MNRKPLLAFVLAGASAASLLTLIGLRFFAPDRVVGENLGFFLMYGSSITAFWAIAEHRELPVGRSTPIFPLLIVSALFSTLLADALLSINYFAGSYTPSFIVVLLPFVCFVVYGWRVVMSTSGNLSTRQLRWAFFATVMASVAITLTFKHVQP